MADSSITVEYQILILAAGLSFLAGFLINAFIVVVNISEWKKGRPVSTADKVITSLGISRMVFQLTSVCSSIFLSTLLSIVFCLKISTLHNAFLLRLKILVLNRVSQLIVVFVMMSFSHCLIFSLAANVEILKNSTLEIHFNVLMDFDISALIFQITGPFLINFISSVLLIIYLYHHVSRMRSKRNTTSDMDPYYKTIKFTGFSLFCSTVYIIIQQTFPFCYYAFGLLGFYFLWQLFPTLHSIYLIYVTAKLRISVSNMFCFLRRT
ncbi:hypothetical protein GDO78_019059 [Eleutherodactylus coqui]|uniref:Taste receptor type 2 n=1 Tax=Eleutherodactylus coqui TaxID=57060 RepID=A0A8J6BL90_ELECQ|nr:hypothetical protein GDO78_019059 [Eleutherodactylus coqui]